VGEYVYPTTSYVHDSSGGARARHARAAARAKLLNSLVVLRPNEDEMENLYGQTLISGMAARHCPGFDQLLAPPLHDSNNEKYRRGYMGCGPC
jgi:hypothetical protein